MFRQYTKCYDHKPGDKPFNDNDKVNFALLHGVLPGALFGALTGLVVGLGAGGPIGAVVGLFAGLTVGTALAIKDASLEYRFHRLVCLTGDQCAVGKVVEPQRMNELGKLDNDQFFDIALMPHRPDAPVDEVHNDKFRGEDLLKQRIMDLSFQGGPFLHCEAEGDFWNRMMDLALALGLLAAALGVGSVAAAAYGASVGCSLGSIFGPIGCFIGAVLGMILGLLLAGKASEALLKEVLQAIFDATAGKVEDANVGDVPLGPILVGDTVVVIGAHVYDGYHEGWHEFHPLKAVMRVPADEYLEHDPNFPPKGKLPIPAKNANLTEIDMKAGLVSPDFNQCARGVLQHWCTLARHGLDENIRQNQQPLSQRWTIHPLVDGCMPAEEGPVIIK